MAAAANVRGAGTRTTRNEAATTPEDHRTVQGAQTHRLAKRQKRRRRNANRDVGVESSAERNEQTTALRRLRLSDSQAEEGNSTSEQERLRRARMRRVRGRHSLRSSGD